MFISEWSKLKGGWVTPSAIYFSKFLFFFCHHRNFLQDIFGQAQVQILITRNLFSKTDVKQVGESQFGKRKWRSESGLIHVQLCCHKIYLDFKVFKGDGIEFDWKMIYIAERHKIGPWNRRQSLSLEPLGSTDGQIHRDTTKWYSWESR